jgi:pentatricopeptide repeat protein
MAQLPTLETAKWVPIWKAQRLLQHSWEQRDIELRYRVFKLLPKVESDDPAKWLKLFKTVAIHPHRPWMLPLLMQRMRDQKVPWTVELFTILLKDQALHGEKDRIIEVLANLNKTGLAKDVAFYTTLISAYGMHKQLDEAFAVIDQMKADKLVPNEVTFTALIAACGDSREPQMALKAFSLMQEHGVQPNVLTLTALLTAFAEAGEIEAIHKTVMEELMKKYDLKPTTTTFNEVMKGYCRVKNPTKVLETYETLKQSGLTPDAHTFFHLFTVALHPLQDFQDEERVKRQVEGLFGEMQRYGLEPGYKILQCVRSARWKDRQAKKKVEDRIMQAIANKVRT